MIAVLIKSMKWLDKNIEFVMCFLFYVYMAGIIVVEVFRRYVLHAASAWGEETAIYAFIWMAYLATAHRVRERRHLSVEILRGQMSRTPKFCAYILSDVCFFILALAVVYYSLGPVRTNIQYGQEMIGAHIPMALASLAVPAAWTLVAFRVVQRFFVTVRRFRSGESLIMGQDQELVAK